MYYVHPSVGSSSVSVTPVLTYSNYIVTYFPDGSILVSAEFDLSYKAWTHCNMLVNSWKMNSVEKSIA